jgi:hypothetical protein
MCAALMPPLSREGGLHKKVEMLLQKLKTRCSKLAQKTKFKDLQIEIFVDVKGCLGHPQAYGIDHP